MGVWDRCRSIEAVSERGMLKAVLLWLSREGLQAKTEFVMPWGVCDVVATAFAEQNVRKRVRLGQTEPIGPAVRIELLYAIPQASSGRSISLWRLEKDLRADADELKPHLMALLDRKFIQLTRRGCFQRVDAWAPGQPRVLAIELKLDRVHDAIGQAVRNQGVAQESYVAFPKFVAERVVSGTLRQAVAATGVGVLGISGRDCSILLRPSKFRAKVDPVLARHCVERFWRSRSKAVHH
jgi:hypothetical protein